MPKRSNHFQKLIYAIHKQLSDEATTVTESKFIVDRVTGVKREVDIVIETTTGDFRITIGIEVSAYNRRGGLDWLNRMSGKHKNLPTDKLVLVSRSGFTQTAIDEGEVLGIELMTLEEAIAVDWTLVVNRLKEIFLARCHFSPTECRAVLADVYQQPDDPVVGPDLILYDLQGRPQGTLFEIIQQVLQQPSILETIYNREDRMKVSTFKIKFPVLKGSYLLDTTNTPRPLKALKVRGSCKFLIDPVPLQHHAFGKSQIAFGEASIAEGEMLLSIVERDDGAMTFELTQLS